MSDFLELQPEDATLTSHLPHERSPRVGGRWAILDPSLWSGVARFANFGGSGIVGPCKGCVRARDGARRLLARWCLGALLDARDARAHRGYMNHPRRS